MERFVSAEPFAPGEFIQEEMEARGWSQEDLAQVLNVSRRHIAKLFAGEAAISPDLAVALGDAFQQDAATWMNLQVTFELAIAAKKQRDVARRAALFDKVPVRELKKRHWLPDVDDIEEIEAAVCKLLRIGKIEDEPQFCIAARKSTNYGYENTAQVAWYMRARQLAERVHASTYDESGLERGIDELLKLACSAESARLVPKALADMGIRLVFLQHLSKTKIDGAAFWLDEDRKAAPVVALSLRYDRIDNFWFSLLHELIHIKYHHASPVDTETEMGTGELPEMEVIANSEAANYLIPSVKIESFIRRMKPLYYQTRVVQFAQSRGIHPGIVVGQLQKRQELKPYQLRKLLVPVREFIVGQTITDGWDNDLWLE